MSDIRRERLPGTIEAPHQRVSWGAILAGTLLALTVQFMLGLLGLGIGLSALPGVGETTGGGSDDGASLAGFASASGLWTVAVVLIGLFVGAFAAGRLSASARKTDAALHGAVTWATATLVVLVLLASGTSAVVSGAFGAIGQSIQGLSQAASAVAPDSLSALPGSLETEARQLLRRGVNQAQETAQQVGQEAQEAAADARQATGEEDLPSAIATLVAGVGENASPEQRQAATQLIAERAGISQQEAQTRLQQFQQRADEAMRQARQAAATAASAVSTASFAAFVALLLGLVVAILGGLAGRPRRVL